MVGLLDGERRSRPEIPIQWVLRILRPKPTYGDFGQIVGDPNVTFRSWILELLLPEVVEGIVTGPIRDWLGLTDRSGGVQEKSQGEPGEKENGKRLTGYEPPPEVGTTGLSCASPMRGSMRPPGISRSCRE